MKYEQPKIEKVEEKKPTGFSFTIDTTDLPTLKGKTVGDECELEVKAVVTGITMGDKGQSVTFRATEVEYEAEKPESTKEKGASPFVKSAIKSEEPKGKVVYVKNVQEPSAG